MKNGLKSKAGFTAIDATIAIVILSISITVIATLMFNTYVQVESTQKNSMATFYAVEILEKIGKMSYNDENLNIGETAYTDGEILDIPIDDAYNVMLKVESYQEKANTDKDLIKIVTVSIGYTDGTLNKSLKMSTLKLNV